jgi:hypothetical protein
LAGKTILDAALCRMRHKFCYAACGITKFRGLPRNLLGKLGWLQQIRFGLVDYDEMIYLSDYNDPA